MLQTRTALVVLLSLLLTDRSIAEAPRAFHVATTGSDDNPGTADRPFATLERARDAVRSIERTTPLTVVLHGGTYVQTKTLELDPRDGGSADCPVTWLAAENEDVRISGGPVLPGDAFTGKTNILQLDLRSLSREQIGEYPETFRGAPQAPELFFNDQRMTIARWPNRGWATIAKLIDAGSIPRDGDNSNRPGVFEYSGDEPSRWNADAGVWLQGYWCYDWYDQTIKVKSIDRERKQITLAAPALYGVRQGNPSPRRFRALNVLEELDEPGEFYIDRAKHILYFWPPGPIERSRISLSTLNAPLLRLKDAEHIVLRGITFEAGLADGIEIRGGRANTIDSCKVRNMRELGIRVAGGMAHRIENCDITDTGAGGLILEGGDRKTLTPANHEAINNHIWNFSRHQLTGAYAIALGGVGNRAANNHIHDAPHQAVFIGGNDHVFELNHVHHVVTETDDAGAVYKGRNPSCRGNIIRHNFFHDIGSPMGHGTAAIYFDDGDGGDLVFGNIFLRCGHPGGGSFGTVFSHGGHDNRAENNIFIDCKRPLGSAPWDDQLWKQTVDGGQDCHWTTKLREEVDITRPPYTMRYPELVGFMNPQPGQPRNNHAASNVFVRCELPPSGNWGLAPDANWTTDQDPGFIDVAGENYGLRSGSDVFKHLPEFKAIPFEKIGQQPRKEK